MPVRQFTKYTQLAVESVLQQTHREIELLIVGNEDIQQLLAQLPTDSRIRGVARQQPGIIGALNTGLPACTGEYIARMDDDDLCHVDRLQQQLSLAKQQPELGLLGACVEIFSNDAPIGDGNKHYQQWLNTQQSPEQIKQSTFVESPLPHPTLFAHNSFWRDIGGYRDQQWPEDYDLILRAWLAGVAMAKPEPVLLRWRDHQQRLTRTDSRYHRQAFINAKAWAISQDDANLQLDQGRGVWICGTGRNARYWHDALVQNKVDVCGFVELDSAKAKTRKRHLPVITYSKLKATIGNALVVSAISSPTARTALREWFLENHFSEGRDFILGG